MNTLDTGNFTAHAEHDKTSFSYIGNVDLFQSSPDMMCLIGYDGCFKQVNAVFTNTLKLDKTDLLEHPFINFVHPDDILPTQQEFQGILTGKNTVNFRNRYRLPSGDFVWLEWSATSLLEQNMLFCIVRDVTEQKRNEDSINQNNVMLSTVSQALSDFISSTSPVNPFDTLLSQLLHLTQSDYGFIGEVLIDELGNPYLKSHSLTNIAWDEATRNFYAQHAGTGLEFRNLSTLFGRVMTTGKPIISNNPMNDPRSGGLPPGHPALNAFLGLPIYSGDQLIGMLGIANRPGGYHEDLMDYLSLFTSTCSNLILAFRSEREKRSTVQQLHHEEAHKRAIVESVVDGIFSLDNAYTIEFCNPGLTKLLCSSPEILLYSNFLDLIAIPSHIQSIRSFFIDFKSGANRQFQIETLVFRRNGPLLPVDLSLTLTNNQNIQSIVGVLRDVTLEKRSREELLKAKKIAEDANLQKSRFVANMSHEIRTPLNGLIGMIELALNTNPSPAQKDFLETALYSSNTLRHLINDILDFSKIEAGKLNLDSTQFNIRDLVHYCIQHFDPAATEKGLEISSNIDSSIPEHLIGDPLRIRQILLNLLGNAVKFTQHGFVCIDLKEIQRDNDTTTINFSIKDTGIGIPQEKQKVIFNSFEQADSSITRRYGGTGLGLSISSALINMMGGRIQLESNQGKGSHFWFMLSLKQGKSEIYNNKEDMPEGLAFTGRKPIPKHEHWKPIRILLAEDNLVNQKLYVHLLRQRGHNVQIACNGLDALAALELNTFDLILMDLQMPVMGGLEACRLIRQIEKADMPRMKIIALTAHAMTGDKERCLEAGMDFYLAKPIKTAELFDAVEHF